MKSADRLLSEKRSRPAPSSLDAPSAKAPPSRELSVRPARPMLCR